MSDTDTGLPTPSIDAALPLCLRAGLVQGVPTSGGRGPASRGERRPGRRTADQAALPVSNCSGRLTDWVVTAKNTGPRLTPPQPAVSASAYSPAGRSARSISLRPTPVSSAPKRVTPIGRRTKANHSMSISRRCPSTIWARPCRTTTGTAHTIAPINHMQRNAGYPLRGCLRCDPAPGGSLAPPRRPEPGQEPSAAVGQ